MEEYYDFLHSPDASSPQEFRNSECPVDNLNFLDEYALRLDSNFGHDTGSSSPCTPNYERLPNKPIGPTVLDEPPKKKYKSKDSERNRRNRINDRMNDLKELLPRLKIGKTSKDFTKEEILTEAIQHINSLHNLLNESEAKANIVEDGDSSPIKKKRPTKRGRMFMAILFMFGLGLWIFPFVNPPENHPLFSGSRIPRHHSRILASANLSMCPNREVDAQEESSSYMCPTKSLEDPNIAEIIQKSTFYCSLSNRRCTPQVRFVAQDSGDTEVFIITKVASSYSGSFSNSNSSETDTRWSDFLF